MHVPSRQILDKQAETMKALAHPARLAMVHALSSGPLCACDLATIAKSSPPTASRHLTVLKHASIISRERQGQQIHYTLIRPCVLKFIECCNS